MSASNILVTLDGSPLAEAALPYAAAIAHATGERLSLLSVVERPDYGQSETGRALSESVLQEQSEGMAVYLDDLASRPLLEGLQIERRVVPGKPVDAILAAAGSVSTSLTVIATHGQGGLRRAFLGSVADKVMRLNATPTLVVRAGGQANAAEPPRLARIMTPLDGSPRAEAALEPAARYARALHAQLVLIRAVLPLEAMVLSANGVYDYSDADKAQDRAAWAYLTGVRKRLAADLDVDLLLIESSPLTLPEYAVAAGIDLVIMTTRGHGGLKRLALGSVADRMVRLGPPVMLIPTRVVERTAEQTVDQAPLVAPSTGNTTA